MMLSFSVFVRLKAQELESSNIMEAAQSGLLEMEGKARRNEFADKFKAYTYRIAGGAAYAL